jgi:hypothetical protein
VTAARRMRRTSSIVSGRAWVEWLERTTFSLPMPFRCALSYRTTPVCEAGERAVVEHGDDRGDVQDHSRSVSVSSSSS